MNNKTLSIVAYITFIGWLIAYFSGKDQADSHVKYHLRQAFGLFVFSVVLSIILNIIMYTTGIYFIGYLGLITPILLILGIINASNGVQKPLPIIGNWSANNFQFIG